MRRSIVAGAVLGIVVLTGAPALAAPAEVSAKTCQGDFSRDHGVKTCTTTTTDQLTTPPVTIVNDFYTAFGTDRYIGVSRRTDVVETTTTESQKGNGDVTTTQSSSVLSSSVVPVSCTLQQTIAFITTTGQAAFTDCAAHHVFLEPSPLGPVA